MGQTNYAYRGRIIFGLIPLLFVGISLAEAGDNKSLSNLKPSPFLNQPTIPGGWKLSMDASGKCFVHTPSTWQIGRDFFIKVDQAKATPFKNKTGRLPPTGRALWSENQPSEGKQFQIRKSLVLGEIVCSVWRIKASTPFTEDEVSEMEQVGGTLQGSRL